MTALKGSYAYEGTLPDVEGAIQKWHDAARNPEGYSHFWVMDGDEYLGYFEFDHSLLPQLDEKITGEVHNPAAPAEVTDRMVLILGMDKVLKALRRIKR